MIRLLAILLLICINMLFFSASPARQVDSGFSSEVYASVLPLAQDGSPDPNTEQDGSRGWSWSSLFLAVIIVLLLLALIYTFVNNRFVLWRWGSKPRDSHNDFDNNYEQQRIDAGAMADQQPVSHREPQSKLPPLEQHATSSPQKTQRPGSNLADNYGQGKIDPAAMTAPRPASHTNAQVKLPPAVSSAQPVEQTKPIVILQQHLRRIENQVQQLSDNHTNLAEEVKGLKNSIESKFEFIDTTLKSINTVTSKLDKSTQAMLEERTAQANEALRAVVVKCTDAKKQLVVSIDGQVSNVLTAIRIAGSGSKNESFRNAMQKLLSEMSSEKEHPKISRYFEAIDLLAHAEQQLADVQEDVNMAELSDIAEAQSKVEGTRTNLENMRAVISHEVDIDRQEVDFLCNRLLKEVSAAYRDAVTAWGSDTTAEEMTILRAVLAKLNLELIDIEIGKTVPDLRLHEIGPSVTNSRYPSGVIVNVQKMGYIDTKSKIVTKARVVINE